VSAKFLTVFSVLSVANTLGVRNKINRPNAQDLFPSSVRVSRGFEEHCSEPANAGRDAARRAGRGSAVPHPFPFSQREKGKQMPPLSFREGSGVRVGDGVVGIQALEPPRLSGPPLLEKEGSQGEPLHFVTSS